MNNDDISDSDDQKQLIVNKYLTTKSNQIQTKLGISIDSNSKDFTENYTVKYIKTLAEEWINIIVKSLANSLKFYLNALLKDMEVSFCTTYNSMLFRELVFYLEVLRLNKSWMDSSLIQPLLDIISGLVTIPLNPPKGQESVYTTLCFLIIAILSQSKLTLQK